MKLSILCDWCGKEFVRDAAQLKGKKHHFCCRQCLADLHHRAGNKYNHIPENLLVFPSVGEPTKFHSELRWYLQDLERLEVENAETK